MRNFFCFLTSFLKRRLNNKNQSPETSTSFFQLLPLEIQETIFSLLPISTLIVCTAVSRSFRSTIISLRFTSSYTRSQTLFRFCSYNSKHSTYDPDLDRWFTLPLPPFSVLKRSLSDSLFLIEQHHARFSIGPYLRPKTTYDEDHFFPSVTCLDDDNLFYLSVDGQLVKFEITSGNQEYLTKTLPINSDALYLFGVDKRLFLVGGNDCRHLFLNNIRIWEFDFLKKEWNLHCLMPLDMFPDPCDVIFAEILGNKGMICFVHYDYSSIVMYNALKNKWWRPKSFGRGKIQYHRCFTVEASIALVNP